MNKFALLVILFLLSSCKWLYFHQDRPKDLYVYNNSDIAVGYFFPTDFESGGYPVEQYPYKMYPDTTMKYAWWFLRGPVLTNDFHAFDGGLVNDVYSFRKSDTLSLYIFDANLLESEVWVPTENGGHFENEAWDNAIRDYNILARYDLSQEDMGRLRDDDGIVRIYYPPTPEMKDMHMFPPYGVREENE